MTMFENMHIFNADMLGAKLQHRTEVVTARRVRFISAPLILTEVKMTPRKVKGAGIGSLVKHVSCALNLKRLLSVP